MLTLHPVRSGAAGDSLDFTPLARTFTIGPNVVAINAGAGRTLTSGMTSQQMIDAATVAIAAYGAPYAGARLAYWEFESANSEGWPLATMIQAQNACESAGPLYTWGSYLCPFTNMFQLTDSGTSAANDAIATLIATCQVHMPDFYPVNTTTTTSPATASTRANLTECRRAVAGASVTRIVPFFSCYRSDASSIEAEVFIATMLAMHEVGIRDVILWNLTNDGAGATATNAVISGWANPAFAAFGPKKRGRSRSAGRRGR